MGRSLEYLLHSIALLAGVWLMAFSVTAQGQAISAANTSAYRGEGRWDWTVFIQAQSEVLKEINCVQYKLHPSFPNPVRKVCSTADPRYPFGLSTNGWGTFQIGIEVTFKNDQVRYLEHRLGLAAPLVQTLPIKLDNIARSVRPGWWEWTVYVEGPETALAQIRCVEYLLHPTFKNPERTVCERGSGPRAFPLSASGWGTFRIRIRVVLKDGYIQEMEHDLRF